MPELTQEQKDKYIASRGDCCPFCGSTSLNGQGYTYESGTVSQSTECTDCEACWFDIYNLVDITVLDS